MPLVAPLSIDGDEEVARLAEFFYETPGYCPNSVLTMMRRPPIARAFIEFNKSVMENKGRVTSALKRLVGFVSSKAAGCSYCQAHTIRAAERYGAEAEKLENVWEYRTHPAFTEAERVALDFALAASTIPNAVDADLQNRLRQHWDDCVRLIGQLLDYGPYAVGDTSSRDLELQLRDALQENCNVLVFWIVRGHVGETRVGMTQVMKIAAM